MFQTKNFYIDKLSHIVNEYKAKLKMYIPSIPHINRKNLKLEIMLGHQNRTVYKLQRPKKSI